MNKKTTIPLSKRKLSFLLLVSLVFVALGIWLTIGPEQIASSFFRYLSRVTGVVAIVFFGMCVLVIFQKLTDKKEGLIIDQNGITDNTNATSLGLIKWTDIIGIRILKVFSQKFIMIDVSNPDYYINLKKNRIGKMAMKMNAKIYGSPICITPYSLKSDFNEIKKKIEKEYRKNVHQ